jgi:hypothetical protein
MQVDENDVQTESHTIIPRWNAQEPHDSLLLCMIEGYCGMIWTTSRVLVNVERLNVDVELEVCDGSDRRS